MKVAVWDTYVEKKAGGIMHFDIVAPVDNKDQNQIHGFGREYLTTKGQDNQPLTSEECSFCHIETATAEMISDIEQQGYHIIEMQGCE